MLVLFKLLGFFSDDLSFLKDATQSHKDEGHTSQDANNAVDRNSSTCTKTKDIGGNSKRPTVSWKVDLGAVYNVYSITILFKNYDIYGLWFVIYSTFLTNTSNV